MISVYNFGRVTFVLVKNMEISCLDLRQIPLNRMAINDKAFFSWFDLKRFFINGCLDHNVLRNGKITSDASNISFFQVLNGPWLNMEYAIREIRVLLEMFSRFLPLLPAIKFK